MNVKTHTMQFTSATSLRVLKVAALATLMTLLAGGAAFGQQVEQAGSSDEREEATSRVDWDAPVELYVRNNNWLDARVYAVRQGTRYRLGTVTSFQIEKFELPDFVTASVEGVQLLVVPIGANTSHLTEEITVLPGDVLGLELEEHLPLSAFFRAS